MKIVTEKQLRRRQDVLSAARQLLSEHGYEGVTMRGLAALCGVSTKFLYDTYGNKDNLLAKAIHERLSLVYEAIEVSNSEAGARRLLVVSDGIYEAMLENVNFAHAYAKAVFSDPGRYGMSDEGIEPFKRCVLEIRARGELEGAVDVHTLTRLINLELRNAIMTWHIEGISNQNLHCLLRLAACHVLKSQTSGESQRILLEAEREAYGLLKSW